MRTYFKVVGAIGGGCCCQAYYCPPFESFGSAQSAVCHSKTRPDVGMTNCPHPAIRPWHKMCYKLTSTDAMDGGFKLQVSITLMPITSNQQSGPDQLLISKLWVHGMILTGVCYGIVVVLSFSCIQLLLSKPWGPPGSLQRQKAILFSYVAVLFILATISMGFSSKEIEIAYVHHQDFPGGPAFFILHDTSLFIAGGAICFVLLQWMVDGLLVRCTCSYDLVPYLMGGRI